MDKFLEKVAVHLLQKYEAQLDKLICILPSRRAGLFLKKYLGEKAGKAIWSPKITTMHDWINSQATCEILNNTQLLFELFEAFKIADQGKTNFSNFMQWGPMLFQDISMIEQYLVDGDLLFKDLRNIKDIDNWSLAQNKLTETQKQYADFWVKIGKTYQIFNESLEKKDVSYSAKLVKDLAQEKIGLAENQNLVFIGFNALSPAEKEIISKLKRKNQVELFWDADKYYIKNNQEEAGHFIRPFWKDETERFNFLGDRLSHEKQINVHPSTNDIQAAHRVGNILKDLTDEELSETALILADEDLLIPILNALPMNISKANISMGLPLAQNALFTLFEKGLKFLKSTLDSGNKLISYNDLVFFFDKALVSGNITAINDFKKNARKANLNVIHNSQVPAILKQYRWESWGFLFTSNIKDTNKLGEKLTRLVELLMERVNEVNTLVEFETLQIIKNSIDELNAVFNQYNQILATDDFFNLLLKQLKREKISFVGKPLEGLQILGMLESRTLDFKHVIIAGMNEGIIPAEKRDQSFIPFELKARHHLPSYKDNEAISSYYFYRLIQGADKIDLLYNETVDFKKSERSRFIEQLEFSSQIGKIKSKLNHAVLQSQNFENTSQDVILEKTPDLIEAIKQKLKEKISPSALKDFIECPLNFYYKHILGLGEYDEVSNDVKTALLGSAVHLALDTLYKPLIGKELSDTDLKNLEKDASEHLLSAFKKDNIFADFRTGIDHLAFKVGEKFIFDFIKLERENVRKGTIRVLELERKISHELQVTHRGEKTRVNLMGIIDRVETVNGHLRIIDYKTGKVDATDLKINGEKEIGKKPKLFQLITYCWLFGKASGNYNLSGGIYSLPRIKNGLISINYDGKQILDKEVFDEFENYLTNLIGEILDLKEPLKHNPQSKYCKFCERN